MPWAEGDIVDPPCDYGLRADGIPPASEGACDRVQALEGVGDWDVTQAAEPGVV